jgi:hypothetical protein
MEGMLELSDQELKTAKINMLRVQMDKGTSMQDRMSIISNEMAILRKNHYLCNKNIFVIEKKNVFDGLINRHS